MSKLKKEHEEIEKDLRHNIDLWLEVIGPLPGPAYICADCFIRAADERLIQWEDRLRLVPCSLARRSEIQAKAAKERITELENRLYSCYRCDRSDAYAYHEPDRHGDLPGASQRWLTPREIALDALGQAEIERRNREGEK